MPISKTDAQTITAQFAHEYPAALKLAYYFRPTVAELYPTKADQIPPGVKGGYLPQEVEHQGRVYRGRVDVPLNHMADAHDLALSLRHEVLGHYGINTLAPHEKRALLDGITAAHNEPTMRGVWADIDRRYAGHQLDIRAEEVFAAQCERLEPSQYRTQEEAQKGRQALFETCLTPKRLMSLDDLRDIAGMVAHGMRDRSRDQQTFPGVNELFRADAPQKGDQAEGARILTMHEHAMRSQAQNFEALSADPRYAQHRPDELAKIAYFRGIYERYNTLDGRAADLATFDATMADRNAAQKLPDVHQRAHQAQPQAFPEHAPSLYAERSR